jgi:hypothetical protein
MDTTFRVYALVDPRNGALRYVGQTKGTLAARLKAHLARPCSAAIRAWTGELMATGLKPRIFELEAFTGPFSKRHAKRCRIRTKALAAEQHWITKCLIDGEPLLNCHVAVNPKAYLWPIS